MSVVNVTHVLPEMFELRPPQNAQVKEQRERVGDMVWQSEEYMWRAKKKKNRKKWKCWKVFVESMPNEAIQNTSVVAYSANHTKTGESYQANEREGPCNEIQVDTEQLNFIWMGKAFHIRNILELASYEFWCICSLSAVACVCLRVRAVCDCVSKWYVPKHAQH